MGEKNFFESLRITERENFPAMIFFKFIPACRGGGREGGARNP